MKMCILWTFSFWLILGINFDIPQPTTAITPDNVCNYCQKVLGVTYYYYLHQKTEKLVKHKIKHLCNRYGEYRRYCMYNLLQNYKTVYKNMRSVTEGQYKPLETCGFLRQCSQMDGNSDDLLFDFMDQNSTFLNIDELEKEDLGNIIILED